MDENPPTEDSAQGAAAPEPAAPEPTTESGQATPKGFDLKNLAKNLAGGMIGGDKKKWTKVAIVSALVIIFMGLASTMAWGMALWALVNSIGEPNGTSAQGCFDSQFTDDWVISGPDPSNAIKTETRTVYATAYCPPETGYDQTEGGQTTASGIHVGLGSIAVPKLDHRPPINGDTSDYPWGTAFEIPGYGTGWAMDVGCAIQKAGAPAITCADGNRYPSTPHDHIDIFVGNGQDACKKWPTRTALEVKIYWFDQSEFPHSNPSRYLKATKTDTTFGSSNVCPSETPSNTNSSMDFRNVGPGLAENDYVGIWKNIPDLIKAIGWAKNGQNIVDYKFMGHNITGGVNKAIVKQLDKVQAELKSAGVSYSFSDVQGYNFRENRNSGGNTGKPLSISPHAFGTAIDINPNSNPNKRPRPNGCGPRDPSCCPKNIPKEVSDIFEKNGFFWGAKFYMACDAMHFQYGGNYDTDKVLWPTLQILP